MPLGHHLGGRGWRSKPYCISQGPSSALAGHLLHHDQGEPSQRCSSLLARNGLSAAQRPRMGFSGGGTARQDGLLMMVAGRDNPRANFRPNMDGVFGRERNISPDTEVPGIIKVACSILVTFSGWCAGY